MPRTAWTDLPAEVSDAVAARTGPILDAKDAVSGAGSDLAIWLVGDGAATFVKAARIDNPDTWQALDREAAVAPYVAAVSPQLRWRVTVGGWDLLGFELLEGAQERAWLEPNSPDVGLTAAALTEVSRIRAPAGLPTAWERWGYWCDPDDEHLFAGDRLVHGDPAAVNFLIHENRVWLVDWAWAMRGPAWIDPMLWGGRLVLDGAHTPDQAAALVREMPALYGASCRGLIALAHAEAAELTHAADEDGDADTARLAHAAQEWADHWK
ncbi:aminoglycoside phosphotransferase [Streptodolium elevatio]|uniref:Aminoglycoside phosphotransferase n=1 Tax=Streptodolium elevatio TaxID=3157996 RepID=A0ABV3DJ41_9ACTN